MDIYTEIYTSDFLLRRAVYDGHEGRCFYTGRFVPINDACVDHIFPKARGGKNCIANYVLTDRAVNSKKTAKVEPTLVERMQYINITAFAPSVLKLYLQYKKQNQLADVDRCTINDYCKLQGITLTSAKKQTLTQAAKTKFAFVVEARPGNTRRETFFYKSDIALLFAEEIAQ